MQSGANNYTSNYAYTPHGAVSQMLLGSGKTEQNCFTSRLQTTKVRLGSGTTSNCALGGDLLHLSLDYGTTSNNGNLVSQTITAPKTAGGNLVLTQNYIYDGLNRLLSG